jgi:predicted YcjX-like family ATPase
MPDFHIAVSGLANAGKTIFITQLISHLEYFKRGHFDLGPGRTITEVKHMSLAVPGVEPFPYEEARAHLLGRDPEWPPATRSVTGIRIEFTLVDEGAKFYQRKHRHYGLEIYDFPGEMLGDVNLPDLSYDKWSEDTLRRLGDPTAPLSVAGTKYLPLLKDVNGMSHETLVGCFHDALELALRHGARSVTPAAWIHTRDQRRHSIPLHFAPLPPDAPKALRERCAEGFEDYRQWLAPLIQIFCRCDHHAILVDVLEILRDGQRRYVERKAALQELIRFYTQAHGFVQYLARYLAMTMRLPIEPPRTALSNAVIVATKADAILEEDRGRLAGLLEEMLASDFKTLSSRISFRVCAAYDATQRETDGRRWVIIGRVPREPDHPQHYAVARVPVSWPDYAWDGSEFSSFRHYLPPKPAEPIRDDATFPHINLNEIVGELLGLASR